VISAQIARDGEDPGGGPGISGVKPRRLAPEQDHRLLRQLLCGGIVQARAQMESFQPRCEMLEEQRKCLPVLVYCHQPDQPRLGRCIQRRGALHPGQ